MTELPSRHRSRRGIFTRFRRHAGRSGEQAMNTVVALDDDSFFTATRNRVTVVDFSAPWCGPCQVLHPMFEDAASKSTEAGIAFARVDVDESPDLASTFGVMSIPTIVVLAADGREVGREVGVPNRRRLEQVVRTAEALVAQVDAEAQTGTSG